MNLPDLRAAFSAGKTGAIQFDVLAEYDRVWINWATSRYRKLLHSAEPKAVDSDHLAWRSRGVGKVAIYEALQALAHACPYFLAEAVFVAVLELYLLRQAWQ